MKEFYDLVVVGGGGSGLTAALRASELGVENIAVMEKNSFTGGNSNFPTGIISLNSHYQQAQGVPCMAEKVYQKVMEQLQWTANPRMVHAYLMNTGKFVDWVIDKELGEPVFKLDRDGMTGSFSLKLPADGPQGGFGSVLCKSFTDMCIARGVDIFTNSQVVELLTEDGAVVGLKGENQQGSFEVRCSAVLISTGGVTGSVEALHKYFPDIYHADDYRSSFSLTSNVGDGIEMAARVGAETGRGMSIFIMGPALHDDYVIGMSQKNPRALWINKSGRRFYNEEKADIAAQVFLAQPGKIIYVIYDSAAKEKIKNELKDHPILRMRGQSAEELEAHYEQLGKRNGKAAVVDTIEELAEFAGVPLDTLTQTIAEYNSACTMGKDDIMGKSPEYLDPVLQPPFYISESTHFYDSSQGGITVDELCRAQTPYGETVPGLFASGDTATGFVSRYAYAPQGAGFTWAFNSGFMAAESIVDYLKEIENKKGEK